MSHTPPQSHGERRWTNERVMCPGCWRLGDPGRDDLLCAICREPLPGRRLAAARELAGYSVLRLAQFLEVPTTAILDAEKGYPVRPGFRRLVCKALDVRPAEIWPKNYNTRSPS
jgi:lambda repressor-like predicted transcriptional regulator